MARRLAAIMFTDMVGYTALGQRNEALSLVLVDEQRKMIRPILARHDGKEVKTIGDAFLVEFRSALEAVRCAYDIQRTARELNISLPGERRVNLRIGIHLGDVVESGGDISGDVVNVASRIVPLSEGGGICVSRYVVEQVQNKFELSFTSMGPKELKNVLAPMEVFKVALPWQAEEPTLPSKPDPRRIAILPFTNMSPDPNDSYFAEGVTEEVISTVSSVSGLSVISRTSVMGYKGTSKRVKEIAKELEVGSVLEGSLRKAGKRIRITTQLIDVNTDSHVWSQSYDRDVDDVFAVQSDIAKQVADALRVKILSRELELLNRKPTEDSEAHSLYLQGRFYWNKRGIEDTRRAVEYFEQAVRKDPAYALGFTGLADCFELLAVNWKIDMSTNHKKAMVNVSKALEIDPDLPEAHATLGLILTDSYKLREAEGEFKKAIELKPGYATAHQWYSLLLTAKQDWENARVHVEKAVELDPVSPIININHASLYSQKGDYPRAMALFRKAIELDPGFGTAHFELAFVYGRLKMHDEMRKEFAKGIETSRGFFPDVDKAVAAFEAVLSEDKVATAKILPELVEAKSRSRIIDSFAIACLYFFLGNVEEGFRYMENSYSEREQSLIQLRNNEFLDSVRADPRYLDFLKRLGLD